MKSAINYTVLAIVFILFALAVWHGWVAKIISIHALPAAGSLTRPIMRTFGVILVMIIILFVSITVGVVCAGHLIKLLNLQSASAWFQIPFGVAVSLLIGFNLFRGSDWIIKAIDGQFPGW